RSPYIHDVTYGGYTKAGEAPSTTGTETIATTGDTVITSKGYDTTIEIVLKPGGEIHETN
ncbi:MAG: hypothetical protein ACRCW2_16450, partial [Cellulosilyticaceae bacterium]